MGFSRERQVNACLFLTQQSWRARMELLETKSLQFLVLPKWGQVSWYGPWCDLLLAFQLSPSNSSSVQPLLSKALPGGSQFPAVLLADAYSSVPQGTDIRKCSLWKERELGHPMFFHHERLQERDGLLEFEVLAAAGKSDMRQQVRRVARAVLSCGELQEPFLKDKYS